MLKYRKGGKALFIFPFARLRTAEHKRSFLRREWLEITEMEEQRSPHNIWPLDSKTMRKAIGQNQQIIRISRQARTFCVLECGFNYLL